MRSRNGFAGVDDTILSRADGQTDQANASVLPTPRCPTGAGFVAGDYAPWVTADGRHSFYRRACRLLVPPGTFSCTIFHAKLDATGIQIEGTPEKIETSGGVTEVAMSRPRTPALSPDQRTLYFEPAGRLPSAARE